MWTANPPIVPPYTRESSRPVLTEALRLAQEAVKLDAQNDDPIAAYRAYSRSVAMLSEVMERVTRGNQGEHGRRSNRAQVRREEEAQRLRTIIETYNERMRVLALLNHIPDELPKARM